MSERNEAIQAWTKRIKQDLRSEIRKQGLVSSSKPASGKKKLVASVTHRFRKDSGDIYRISLGAERHGWIATNIGEKWKWDNSKALYQVGGFKTIGNGKKIPVIRSIQGRKIKQRSRAKDWAFPLMDAQIPLLATELAELNADTVVNDSYVISARGKQG